MAVTRITTNVDAATVRRMIALIPSIIRGTEKDKHGLHNRFWGAVALSMFESMSKAFDKKSQQGADDLGLTWHDITPHTKAYSRKLTTGDAPGLRSNFSNKNTIGLLSPKQYKQWKGIFAAVFMRQKDKLGETEAKIYAGKVAWTKMKERGASTKIDVLGNRNLLVMRNTEKLYRSFLPGKLSSKSYRKYNKDQVYIVKKGQITVGTSVEYASDVFDLRPLWAGDITPWIKKAAKAGKDRIVAHLKEVL
jgi:hypothetical protein